MNTLQSRDGKVTAELMALSTSFALHDAWPGGSPANALSKIAWSNKVAGAVNVSQAAFTVTAASGTPFTSADVGKVMAITGATKSLITGYTDTTHVTVSVSQTVGATTYVLYDQFGSVAGTSQVFTVAWVVRPVYLTAVAANPPLPAGFSSPTASGTVGYYGYANQGTSYDQRNGFGEQRGVEAGVSNSGAISASILRLLRNRSNQNWCVLAMVYNGTSFTWFLDGQAVTVTGLTPETLGVVKVSSPSPNLVSGASTNFDWDVFENGIFWSQNKFAACFAWSRALGQQELLDLYGMLKTGCGYAPSRVGLEVLWYARRDSTTAADVATLPAVGLFDVKRTDLPDLSGHGRAGHIYSQKATWADVLDGSNADSNPGIYVPRVWIDDNLYFDNVNSYTKKVLTVNGNGGSTFS